MNFREISNDLDSFSFDLETAKISAHPLPPKPCIFELWAKLGLKGKCICSEKCAAWSDMALRDLVQDHCWCRSSDTGDFLCKAGARLYQGWKNACYYLYSETKDLI